MSKTDDQVFDMPRDRAMDLLDSAIESNTKAGLYHKVLIIIASGKLTAAEATEAARKALTEAMKETLLNHLKWCEETMVWSHTK